MKVHTHKKPSPKNYENAKKKCGLWVVAQTLSAYATECRHRNLTANTANNEGTNPTTFLLRQYPVCQLSVARHHKLSCSVLQCMGGGKLQQQTNKTNRNHTRRAQDLVL